MSIEEGGGGREETERREPEPTARAKTEHREQSQKKVTEWGMDVVL